MLRVTVIVLVTIIVTMPIFMTVAIIVAAMLVVTLAGLPLGIGQDRCCRQCQRTGGQQGAVS